jgi:hypothetical protein
MSFAKKNNQFVSQHVQTFDHGFISLKQEERPQTQNFFRLSRYVNEKIRKIRSYRTFLVALKPSEPITDLLQETDVPNLYVKIHIPQTHTLNKTNYTLTLEDLSHRLNNMNIRFPLCVFSSENNPATRLNYQQAMGGSIDGKDYVLFVFVYKSEIQSYKKLWPNQVLVELPFEKKENWRDLSRQTIKVFGETLGSEYVFMLEDNIYCSYKFSGGNWESVSMLEYFQALQESATKSGAPLVGSLVSRVGDLNVARKESDWENNVVQTAFAVKTSGFDVYFGNVGDFTKDQGLTEFNRASNDKGLVLQSQNYLLQFGYSMDDPIVEGVRQPDYMNVEDLEPELSGFNLKVKLCSLEVVCDKTLSDESRYARALGIISDSTAAVVLVAKDDQVDLIPGQSYSIRNAKVIMFKGWIRVEVGEWGKIESVNEEIKPNTKTNVSKTEYELVDNNNQKQKEKDNKEDKD